MIFQVRTKFIQIDDVAHPHVPIAELIESSQNFQTFDLFWSHDNNFLHENFETKLFKLFELFKLFILVCPDPQ